jgi:hypothetical protein
MSDTLQVWVRNDKGQVYGPLAPPSVELLIDNGIITGRLQVSTDGEQYVFPGRIPGLRMIFPRELWGDTVVPGDELDAQWSEVSVPPAINFDGTAGASPAAPVAPAGGPVAAGPGARAAMAGPGARAASSPSAVRSAAGPPMARPQPARPAAPPVVGPPGTPAAGPASVAEASRAAGQGPVPPARPLVPPARPPAAMAPTPIAPPPPAIIAPPPPEAPLLEAEVVAAPVIEAEVVSSEPAPPMRSSGSGLHNVASVGSLAVPPGGQLGELTPLHLYYRAAAGNATGLLTLKLTDRELVVHFRKGNPEFIDSTHPDDSLDTFLIAQRLATAEQIAQAEAQKARFGDELLPALFGLGLLNPNAVFQQLGQRAGNILFRVLTAEQGTFAFDLEELSAAKAMPLGNKWSLYLEQLRKLPLPEVKRRVQAALPLPIFKGSGPVPVSEVRLTPQETRAYNHFDGVRSLAQLVSEFPQEADTMLRVAFMLHPLELVSYAAAPVSAARPAPVVAPPPAPEPPKPIAPPPPAPAARPAAPVAAAPPPARPATPAAAPQSRPPAPFPGGQRPVVPGPAPVAAKPPAAPPARPPPVVSGPSQVASSPSGVRAAPSSASGLRAVPSAPTGPSSNDGDVKQLQQLYEQMKKQNYFELLGVNRNADANAVKMAYLRAARSYHPDTVPPNSPPELVKAKADIFALIGEANRTLTDPVLRQEYVGELDAGGTGEKIDVEKILRAEEFFSRGMTLVKNRKYADALKAFDDAIANNADEPEFWAWRGYVKFLLAPDKKLATAEATKDITHCTSRNQNVANAYYFLGFIAKTNGDLKAARTNFKKCVDLDPKHIDAQRELRLMK